MSIFTPIIRIINAFREAYLSSSALNLDNMMSDFEAYEARLLRYSISAANYENTSYRDIHSWARAYRETYDLYAAIRNVYNPTYRLVEFWMSVIWGGLLDEDANETGAIPIADATTKLRTAIAQLWKDSYWGINKNLITLWGVNLGDVGVKVVDDPNHGTVFLQPIHPSNIFDLTLDTRGNVKGYVLVESRVDEHGKSCEFREVCERGDGDEVVFSTFKDGVPHGWDGKPHTWTELYGFVPFAFFRHNHVGKKYGWCELHAGRSKIHELDDLASKLHDYIRKSIDPIWLFNFRKPRKPINFKDEASDTPRNAMNKQVQERVPAIYAEAPSAKAQPLVTDMVDVEKVTNEVQKMIAELERDYPELQMDIWTAGGYTTGKALKTARQRVEKKVLERRPAYDQQMLKLNQMGVAIGGYRGYKGYEGFGLDSYKAGDLKHKIPTARPIFQTDVLETVEAKQVLWQTVAIAKKNNIPIEPVLEDLGWSKTRIADFMAKMNSLEAEPEPPVEETQIEREAEET